MTHVERVRVNEARVPGVHVRVGQLWSYGNKYLDIPEQSCCKYVITGIKKVSFFESRGDRCSESATSLSIQVEIRYVCDCHLAEYHVWDATLLVSDSLLIDVD